MINAIMKKLFQRELKVSMDDKYRGYGIKLLGGGFQLYYDNKLEGTYQTCYDDKENLQKAKNTIDSKYREIQKDVKVNIQRVDAQVKLTRDSGC